MIIDFPLGATSKALSTIAALKALNSHSDGDQVQIAGYYAPGDGGGGSFYYDAASSTTDNGGTIIAPTAGSGRWKRIYYGEVDARAFGLVGDGSDETSLLQKAIDALAPVGVLLRIPSGTYRCKNVLIRNGSSIRGAGASTILKLLDGSVVGDHVLRGENTTSGVDNVYIGHIKVDGNGSAIGLSDVSMHGIYLVGGHNNWTIENVTAQNTCGDGVTVSTPDGGIVPTNIRIINVSVLNSGRQDISVVRASGVTIADCSGDGRLDLESNVGDAAAGLYLRDCVITNARFAYIQIEGKGAEAGGYIPNNISATGLYASTEVRMWQTAKATITNVVCGGQVIISECDRVTITGVTADSAQVISPNNTTIRNCLFSNFQLSCSTASIPGLKVVNAVDCTFSDFDIKNTGTSGDGVQIPYATAQSGGTLTFNRFTISHNRYGFYVIPTVFSGMSIYADLLIKNEGTKAIYVTTGSVVSYGDYTFKGVINGGITMTDFSSVHLDGVKIVGDYNILLKSTDGAKITIGDVEIIRSSAGTTTLDLQDNTNIASLVIGRIRQRASGTITAMLTGSTFASGVKAWIDGPVVEATTWASTLADANIKEGSMYRLRGNTTNWGYTHNGTSWVAKAH